MARLDTNGLDSLLIDLETLAMIPDRVVDEMLMAGGEVIKKAHISEIQALGLVNTGKLSGSVTIHKKMHSATMRYVLIYPYGTHHRYRAGSHSYTKMNWGRAGKTQTAGGGTGEATNNDVGFVHEFGGHGNAALGWMRRANEKHIDEAVSAEYGVYDRFVSGCGL